MEGQFDFCSVGEKNKFSSERILLSAAVIHFSSTEIKSPMTLILTSKQMLLISKDAIAREIKLLEIDALTLSEISSEFVVHVLDDEDERLSCFKNRKEIVQMILCLRSSSKKQAELESPFLYIYFVKDVNLDLYTTTYEDLEEGRLLRPANTFKKEMDSGLYLEYEEQKEKNRKSHRELTKVLYTETKKNISVEDFELIHTLGQGAHGKVLLCEKKGGKGELYAMKILKKQHIIEAKQLEHTMAENLILCHVNHPFLVSLKYAFQTEHKIYFVMEFMKGGELFQHLKRVSRFTEEQTKFITACLVLALGQLHNKDYIYRDLKPENVLLDEKGFAKLSDFGLAKSLKVEDVATTFCGTPEYLAPEVILDKGCNRPADWWSLGILVYELIFGIPPFYSENVQKMYKNTIMNPLKFKKDTVCSDEAKDFISGLLAKQPEKRLGSIADSLEVMNHPWLRDFDWFNLIEKKLKPPFNPSPKDGNWVKNFDPSFTTQAPKDSICYLDPRVLEEFSHEFAEFNYFSVDSEQAQTGETTPINIKTDISGFPDPPAHEIKDPHFSDDESQDHYLLASRTPIHEIKTEDEASKN